MTKSKPVSGREERVKKTRNMTLKSPILSEEWYFLHEFEFMEMSYLVDLFPFEYLGVFIYYTRFLYAVWF